MGQKNYHGILMPLHDSMPSFMNFRRALDLLQFKNQVSQCLRPSDDGRVFDIHSHFLHGTCRGIVTLDVLVKGLNHGAIATRKLEGVNRDKRHESFILVRPLTMKVQAYV